MKFAISSAVLALISSVFAQTPGFDAISQPEKNENVAAGSTKKVVWSPSAEHTGTVTITLLQGTTDTTLQIGDAIASGIDNSAGSYSWAVDSTLGEYATYGLKISLDSDPTIFQYSFPFHITGSGDSAPVGTVSSASAATPNSEPGTPATPSSSSTTSASSSAPIVSAPSSVAPSTTSSGATTQTTGSGQTTGPSTIITTTGRPTSTGTATASSSTTSFATAGAGKVMAGSFAAMGGMAAALLAL